MRFLEASRVTEVGTHQELQNSAGAEVRPNA